MLLITLYLTSVLSCSNSGVVFYIIADTMGLGFDNTSIYRNVMTYIFSLDWLLVTCVLVGHL